MDLVQRAKNILIEPKKEWPVIEGEQADVASLYTRYIVPLAAIGPVASLIGLSMVGFSVPIFGRIRVSFATALQASLVQYALSLGAVFVLALVIEALAPNFGARKDRTQALKLATYSSTASWVAGVFALIPDLAILGLVGLYGLYLLFLGLPVLMKAPADKAGPYTGAVVLAAVLIFLVIHLLAQRLAVPTLTL